MNRVSLNKVSKSFNDTKNTPQLAQNPNRQTYQNPNFIYFNP